MGPMPEQSFSNHAKFVPPFHFFILPIALFTFIGSLVNLYHSLDDHSRLYNAALLATLSFAVLGIALFARLFALGAQDRAIRAEQNLRHYVMTNKLLDSRLTQKQIVGLRFASDQEFVALATRAASEAMDQKTIKQSIKTWRADHERV
jgi:hypothetical protein